MLTGGGLPSLNQIERGLTLWCGRGIGAHDDVIDDKFNADNTFGIGGGGADLDFIAFAELTAAGRVNDDNGGLVPADGTGGQEEYTKQCEQKQCANFSTLKHVTSLFGGASSPSITHRRSNFKIWTALDTV